MHVCFTQIKKRVAAAPGYSLLAKAVSCAVSVVTADCVQGGAATNRVQREISVSVATGVATNSCFWQIDLLPFYVWKMTLPHLKSIPAGFYKLNCRYVQCISKKTLYSWLV